MVTGDKMTGEKRKEVMSKSSWNARDRRKKSQEETKNIFQSKEITEREGLFFQQRAGFLHKWA